MWKSLLLVWIPLWVAAQAPEPALLQYTVSPVFDERQSLRALSVQLVCTGTEQGATLLELPGAFGGAQRLQRCISRLRCTTPGLLVMNPDSSQISIQHAPGDQIVLRYEVRQDVGASEWSVKNAFRPRIQAQAFHVLGAALLVRPFSQKGYRVRIQWKDFPAHWPLWSSWGPDNSTEAPDTRWLEAVFAGGPDWRIHQTDVYGQPVQIALLGDEWPFSDSLFVARLKEIIQCQRDFWQDRNIPFFSITLMPLAAGQKGFVGTGVALQQSFSALATPSQALNWNTLQHLFHHEMMHHWIGGQIRNGGPPNDMRFAWFSEGFTEYFAWQNQLRCGSIDSAQYAAALNRRFFKTLWQMENAEAPNSFIENHFFENPEANALPYRRGLVLAFYLDQHIQKRSGGKKNLADAMVQLLDHYRKEDSDLYRNFDVWLQTISSALGKDARVLYQKHIVEGRLIPPNQFPAPPGFQLRVAAEGWPEILK